MNTDVKLLEALTSELNFLRKLVHYQRARIEALEAVAIANISNLTGQTRASIYADLHNMTQQVYDEQIAKIEKDHPGYAARIDIRSDLDSGKQDQWYLPHDPQT